jgi:hypothetical protein
MHSIQEYSNLLAIIDSLGANINQKGQTLRTMTFGKSSLETPKVYNLTDGTSIEACTAETFGGTGFQGA